MMLRSAAILGCLLIIGTITPSGAQLITGSAPVPDELINSDAEPTALPCTSGGSVAVQFSNLPVSKYLVYVAAALLLLGIFQILFALFVFLSEALDIYMLLINYCVATIFCIITILLTGSGLFEPGEKMCLYLSPLSCIAISVPMFTLFLLSYSRFYAITYPFYYVDRFTVATQTIVCLLSWCIPLIVVGLGSAFLCQSESIHSKAGTALTGTCVVASQDTPLRSYSIEKLNRTEMATMQSKIDELSENIDAMQENAEKDKLQIQLQAVLKDSAARNHASIKLKMEKKVRDSNAGGNITAETDAYREAFASLVSEHYATISVGFINVEGSYPARVNCQIFMMLYVMICLILPLLGCIVCYGSIVYQLTIIKKNREKMTVTSSSAADDNMVTVHPEESEATKPVHSRSLSIKNLKHHLKRQTSKISQQAKDKIPVSVILILTLYVFVAVPLTIVEIFNTNLGGAEESLGWINIDKTRLVNLRREYSEIRFCPGSKGGWQTEGMWKMILLDICYSVGLLSLGLSPWAYIKFTKSFEENLWKKPISMFSDKLGLEIQRSVRKKHTTENAAKAGHSSAAPSTTSGYSSAVRATGPSNVSTGRSSNVSSGRSSNVAATRGHKQPS